MSDLISEIVTVVPTSEALYMLFVEYEEGDGGNGVGHIMRTDGGRQTVLDAVLATNDILRCLWASPSGALWASSEDGNVWTSAKVNWPKPTQDDLGWLAEDPSLDWTVTTLPDLREEGYEPTLGVLWGTGDSDVFAAASGGHIYHWNGESWNQVYTADDDIYAFAGTGPRDVYAVGHCATLLHYDGNAWTRMRVPAGGTPREIFSACMVGSDGDLLACSMDGRLLHGSAGGFTVLAHNDDLRFCGIAPLDDRVILAADRDGVWEFRDGALHQLRDTFHAATATPGRGKVYFLDAAALPVYIEYDPAHPTQPWCRITY